MSTTEDFENALFAATATRDDGLMAVKIDDGEGRWLTPLDTYLEDEDMMYWGYTLDQPAPATVREALDMAWELAHEVKEGQVIPVGVWLIDRRDNRIVVEKNTFFDIAVDEWGAENIRTLAPLTEPEPDWLDAPAVMARVKGWVSCRDPQVFTRENKTGTQWVLDTKVYRWDELIDVTPLYPKEGQDA